MGKIIKKIGLGLSLIIAVPVVLLIRAIRPLVLIRFGKLPSGRIGQLTCYPQNYFCERAAGMQPPAFDIFYHTRPVCNEQLKKMWDRTLRVWQFAEILGKSNRYVPGGEAHVVPLTSSDRDIHGLMLRPGAVLSFRPEEERQGREQLKKYGVSQEDSIVCLHSRSPDYLQEAFPDNDWKYHSYRDSQMKDFIPAVEELARRKHYIFRVGAFTKDPLMTSEQRIIDYSLNGRTDFMDIYLGSKCRFYLGDSCGIAAVPMIFRRPLALANIIPLEWTLTWSPDYLFIPKKLWLKQERRFLMFREILESGVGRQYLRSHQYEKAGIEVINNTADEIKDLAIEMDERLNKTWQSTQEDEELQAQFWKFFKTSQLHNVLLARIGTVFLRQNRALLG